MLETLSVTSKQSPDRVQVAIDHWVKDNTQCTTEYGEVIDLFQLICLCAPGFKYHEYLDQVEFLILNRGSKTRKVVVRPENAKLTLLRAVFDEKVVVDADNHLANRTLSQRRGLKPKKNKTPTEAEIKTKEPDLLSEEIRQAIKSWVKSHSYLTKTGLEAVPLPQLFRLLSNAKSRESFYKYVNTFGFEKLWACHDLVNNTKLASRTSLLLSEQAMMILSHAVIQKSVNIELLMSENRKK